MYAKFMAAMVDPVNPYEIAEALPEQTPSWFGPMPTIMQAMAIDVHDDLKAAWRAIQEAEDGSMLQSKMLERFDAMPFTAAELRKIATAWEGNPRRQNRDRMAWTSFFLENYRAIAAGDP
jgi:hypothetical protein